jgi:glucokinase
MQPSAAGVSAAVGGDGAAAASPRAVLGLDVGGTKLAAGVVDATGAVSSFVVAPTHASRGPGDGVARLFDLARRAVEESGLEWGQIDALGIGCGGPLDDERGVLIAPPHLPGWTDVPLTELAEQEFDRRAVLANDATAAAAGEHRFGAGRGLDIVVYLTISTGVGGGAVVHGRLYRGATGNGAELGHVTVDCNGRRCPGCGRAGCLEAYVSGTSIAARAREALAGSDGTSTLAAIGDVAAADVAAAARDGDALALAVWDATTAMLACGVVSIVNVFEPDVVIVGGGVSRAGEQLLAPVREAVRTAAMSPAGRAARIVASPLGDRVGVVGAAAIAYERAAEVAAAR